MQNPHFGHDFQDEIVDFVQFSAAVGIDVIFGVAFGWLVNAFVLILNKKFRVSMPVCLVIQLTLIVAVLYYLHRSPLLTSLDIWQGPSAYGIAFIATFVAAQSNMLRWFGAISLAEDDLVDSLITSSAENECIR